MVRGFHKNGFTLIELVIVVAIIGILSAIVYPNYQNYVIRTKRTDMMTELGVMAGRIEATKLAQGSYSQIRVNDYQTSFPKTGQALYAVTMTTTQTNGRITGWVLTATPESNTIMARDGNLTYNNNGVKCRAGACGTGDEWRD